MPPKKKMSVNEMDGDGALSSIANLAIKAISHLLPNLLAKGGEEVGSAIGSLIGNKIKTLHQENKPELSGSGRILKSRMATATMSPIVKKGSGIVVSGSGLVVPGSQFKGSGLPTSVESHKKSELSGRGRKQKGCGVQKKNL